MTKLNKFAVSVAPGHTETVFSHDTFRPLVEKVSKAVESLKKHRNFDVLVGCGNSGVPLLGAVSFYTGIPMLVVRKSRADIGHDTNMVNGTLVAGGRWLFIDDFISSGATFCHVAREIERACLRAKVPGMAVDMVLAYGTAYSDWERHLTDYETGLTHIMQIMCVKDVLDGAPSF